MTHTMLEQSTYDRENAVRRLRTWALVLEGLAENAFRSGAQDDGCRLVDARELLGQTADDMEADRG